MGHLCMRHFPSKNSSKTSPPNFSFPIKMFPPWSLVVEFFAAIIGTPLAITIGSPRKIAINRSYSVAKISVLKS